MFNEQLFNVALIGSLTSSFFGNLKKTPQNYSISSFDAVSLMSFEKIILKNQIQNCKPFYKISIVSPPASEGGQRQCNKSRGHIKGHSHGYSNRRGSHKLREVFWNVRGCSTDENSDNYLLRKHCIDFLKHDMIGIAENHLY